MVQEPPVQTKMLQRAIDKREEASIALPASHPEDILYIAVPSFGMFNCMTTWPPGTSVYALPSLHTTPYGCICREPGGSHNSRSYIFDLMPCSRSFMLEEPLLCVAPCT